MKRLRHKLAKIMAAVLLISTPVPAFAVSSDVSYASAPTSHSVITVDGINYYIGTESVSGSTTKATVDEASLKSDIGIASSDSGVIFAVSSNSSVYAQLLLRDIVDMAKKNMILIVKSEKVSYTIHASSIDTAKIISSLGNADSGSITFTVGISSSNAALNGATLVVSPISFTLTCENNGKTVSIDSFSRFEERSIEITKDQANLISTAVVVEQNGNLHQVPTKIAIRNGNYYAILSSLTNSTYAIVSNTVDFDDIDNHWAMDAINDMGSRMILTGVSDNIFDPERSMTRAEFAAIIVRSLGLDKGLGSESFSDVSPSVWYSGYIQTAVGYGIASGYGDGSFKPDNTITREQAMTMLARAAYLTGLIPQISGDEADSILSKYSDASEIPANVRANAAVCTEKGLIFGRANGTLASKDFVTRAEIAVMIQRLLQNSNLI